MSKSENIEDLFQKFAAWAMFESSITPHDSSAIDSFSMTISIGTQLTLSQSKFIMRLLKNTKKMLKI